MEKNVMKERQLICDGYIVKVMKTHKQVVYMELI